MVFDLFAALAAGYLIGGIPTAELVARRFGTSIFEIGSRNMGAMNAARHLSWPAGLLVLAGDVGKGAAATGVGLWMANAVGSATLAGLAIALTAGFGAVLGHAWSPFVHFRGGKALATGLGVSLPLYPMGGAFGFLLLVSLLLMVRRATPATLIMVALYPVVVLFTLFRQGVPEQQAFAIFTGVIAIALVGLIKHVQIARKTPDADRFGDANRLPKA